MSSDEQPTSTEFGTPEGRRVIQLLWDPPAEPDPTTPRPKGPRPRTNLAGVVAAGVAIADAEGLEPLSMRKVAGELGIGAMSLYTYVPGRSELIELMIDAVYAEHERLPADRPWRERLEHWCRGVWGLYQRHSWLLDHNMARLPIGPHVLTCEEDLYAALAAAGFAGTRNVAVANVIRWQLYGAGRATIGDWAEERRTGVSAEAFWEARSSFWATYFDFDRFPTMAAIWRAGGFDDTAAWDFEPLLTRLVDGIVELAARTDPESTA